MTSKFWYLTNQSIKKKMKSKWFLIANIFILFLIVGVTNIDRIISYFGGDFNKSNEIIVIDETGYSYDIFNRYLDSTNAILEMDYKDTVQESHESIETLKKSLTNDNKILIVLKESDTSYLDASIISKSYIDTSYYQYLYQALSSTKMEVSMMKTDVDQEELQKITSAINVNREILNDGEKSEDEMMTTVMGSVFPTVILPVFMLVIFLVQMIGSEIYEEKSTRSMEIIISNVSPKTHFFSKVVAGNVFVITQGILLFLYALIAYGIRTSTGGSGMSGELGEMVGGAITALSESGIMGQLYYIIPLTLVLLVLSFVTYSLIAGILASMTVSMEDYQQIQTPIIFICLIAYYLSIMAGLFHGSIFIRILSYVPLISSLLSPALLVIGDIGIIDVIISIIILILFNMLLIKKGLKIYKVGILNYNTDKMWKKIFKAVKEK